MPLFLYLLLHLASDARPAPISRPEPVRTLSACALVTRADVERALGRSVGNGKEEADGGNSSCDYAGGKGQVTITIQRLKSKPDMTAELASLKAAIPDARVREVGGLGPVAFFLDIADYGTQLHVIRGDRDYVLVSVLGFGDAEQVSAAAERMARQALQRF